MKTSVVILICLVVIIGFAGLVNYGWTHRYGGEMDTTLQETLVLAMPRMDQDLDLAPDDLAVFDAGAWEKLEPLAVPLLYQVTTHPHGQNLVPKVDVRAFHNGKDAYFLFEWKDQASSRVHDTAEFPDCVAVGFSLAKDPPSESIMMGFRSPVNIWQWKANLDARVWDGAVAPSSYSNKLYTYAGRADIPSPATEVTSACQDLIAVRPGTVTVKDTKILSGRGRWLNGTWRVIVKRTLTTQDAERDAQLLAPGRMRVTFAVWNGDKGDRGSRKSISEWVILDIKKASSAPPSTKDISIRDISSLPHRASAPAWSGAPFALVPLPLFFAQVPSPGQPAPEKPRVINITAKRFEYNPSEITLQKNELVTFRMESLDVTHGLFIDGYGVDIMARPGMIGKATFRADKTGRFTFRCSQTCGTFHPYMVGYLTVEPNSQFHLFVLITVAAFLLLAAFVLLGRNKKEAA